MRELGPFGKAVTRFFFKTELRTFLFGLSALLGSIALEQSYGSHGPDAPEPSHWIAFAVKFLEHLGVALIIGAIIISGIERAAKIAEVQRLTDAIRQITKSVLVAIYGERVSDGIFKFVEQHIINQPFARRNLRVAVDIAPLTPKTIYSDNDIVIVRINTMFDLQNLTEDEQTYGMKLFVEKPWDSVYQKDVKVTAVVVDLVDTPASELGLSAPPGNFMYFGKDIAFAPNQRRRFKVEYQFIKYARDLFSWRSVLRCDGMYFDVKYPPGFDASAEAICSGACIDQSSTAFSGLISKWIPHPMMPHNGFELWWRPTRSAAVPGPAVEGEGRVDEKKEAPVEGAPDLTL